MGGNSPLALPTFPLVGTNGGKDICGWGTRNFVGSYLATEVVVPIIGSDSR
jgi:hypothetical protein